jgi:hypothetical protein
MSKIDLICLCFVVFGLILFLYGANVFDAAIGWIGLSFLFGGILFFLILYIYRELTKNREVQNS